MFLNENETWIFLIVSLFELGFYLEVSDISKICLYIITVFESTVFKVTV